MRLRTYRTFQALILAGSGLGLLVLVVDGHMLDYIHQSFVFLVFIAALAMIVLAQFVLRERPSEAESVPDGSSERPAWGLWLAALPLLIGLLIPDPHFAVVADQIGGVIQSPGQHALARTVQFSALEMNEDMQDPNLPRGKSWVPVYDQRLVHFRAFEGSPVSLLETLQIEAVPEPLPPYRNP